MGFREGGEVLGRRGCGEMRGKEGREEYLIIIVGMGRGWRVGYFVAFRRKCLQCAKQYSAHPGEDQFPIVIPTNV